MKRRRTGHDACRNAAPRQPLRAEARRAAGVEEVAAAPSLHRRTVMTALTIKQPWVHAILREGKDIENRSWQRSFRGWLAIHASAQPRRGARFPRALRVPDLDTLEYSAICGVARAVDIVTKSHSKWFWRPDDGSTNYGWVLADVKALKK